MDSETNIGKLSLVLPCYNPPAGWEEIVVESVQSIESELGEAIELIIVNDGSFKNVDERKTTFIQNSLKNVKFINHDKNQGKGQALRTGITAASGEITIFTDIDFPYSEKSFLDIYKVLKNGNEVALGHRDRSYYKHTPTGRKLISKVLRYSLKSFLHLPTDDSQCGIKGFRSNGKQVFLETSIDRFLFDLEFIKLISRRKIESKNIEVELKPGVIFSKVNLKILAKESLNFLKILLKR